MKTTSFGIHFVLRINKIASVIAPIYTLITVDSKRCEISVKRRILVDNWDFGKGMAKSNQYDFYREYNQNRKLSKNGLINDLSVRYHVVKLDDLFYLNNHPEGIQDVSLNTEELKSHLEGKNYFTKPIIEMVRLLPW
jgi:hypothetical protein